MTPLVCILVTGVSKTAVRQQLGGHQVKKSRKKGGQGWGLAKSLGVLSHHLKCELIESLRGNTVGGQQDREPLRGKSASERVSEREMFRVFSEVLRDF